MTERKKLVPFLLWAFGVAWTLQLLAARFYARGNTTAYQLILMAVMLTPMAAVLLSRAGFKELGWKPRLKKNWKLMLLASLLPTGLTILGAALYFLLFPAAFDTSFSYTTSQLGEAGAAEMEAQGMTMPMMAAVSAIQVVTAAPFVNMFFAAGEEAGWRGVMYPILKEKLGTLKGRILGGVIWGAWHWPLMILTGYEYGTGYWGEPFTGMALFCVFTVSAGILLDRLYEKTHCIWLPSLAHGAINAAGGLPMYFLSAAYADRMLLGPAMIGVIAGLPMLLTAVLLSRKKKPEARES